MHYKVLHEEFLKIVTNKIKNIMDLEKAGKKKEAALANLELANFKVEYYAQFVDPNEPTGQHKKVVDDDYHNALINLANVRDQCMDLGIFE